MSDFEYKGNLFYKFYDTKSSQTLVFLHGFSLDHRMWQPQIDHFSSKYNVLVYDLRGFGKSSLPTQEYSHYDDLLNLLMHLNVKKVHLVGLSMGGRVAIDFTLEHPSYVKSLTLFDTSLGGYKSEVDWKIQVINNDIESAKKEWINHPVFKYSLNNPETKSKLDLMLNDYSGWHWLNGKNYEQVISDAKDHLNQINVPTIVGVGEYDLEYFHNIARFIELNVASSKYVVIRDAGHMSNVDNIEFVNELITQLINK
jgi:pimeloyl-ACP methyl ester carboxylesterase